MRATVLRYLDNPEELEGEANITEVMVTEDGRSALILDSTLFYPQGGGQPGDQGSISFQGGEFTVNDTRFKDGQVIHYGEFLDGKLPDGGHVKMAVNKERRVLNCRNHTAGHLVDVAMQNVGYEFPPAKGYHFADSPYVEYVGVIEPDDRPSAMEKLNAELARLIAEDSRVDWEIVASKADLEGTCKYIPDYLPEGKPIRVVTVADFGCPCGGTHVKYLGELQGVTIHKIKAKNGNTRVTYRLQ